MVFALRGDGVTLPCRIPSIKPCSSINWSMAGEFGSVTEVVKAGMVTAENNPRLGLLKDCSLKISHLELEDARRYSCYNGALYSNVSLGILEGKLLVKSQIIYLFMLIKLSQHISFNSPVTKNLHPADGTIELHCFLNRFKGYVPCNNSMIHIKWSTEDNTPLNGNRFRFENPSECFSKLIINKKMTDHQRKWKCQLLQNDTVKAAISYTTTVKGTKLYCAPNKSCGLTFTKRNESLSLQMV